MGVIGLCRRHGRGWSDWLAIHTTSSGGSGAAATSKMERFVIIINGCQPLTIITKRSILDVAAALDPPLTSINPQRLLLAIYQFCESGR